MVVDFSTLDVRQAHDLLTSCIIPRPIAWVTTINDAGKPNIAPFSFFTGIQWHPPVLAFSVVNRDDGSKKDTIINIEQTNEFVINLVSVDLLGAMERSAKPIAYGTDDYVLKDIVLVPSDTVKPCRISAAKVSFECALDRVVRVDEGPNAGNLVIGRVLLAHFDDGIINGREVDWKALNPLGRLSGNKYCAIDGVIHSETN